MRKLTRTLPLLALAAFTGLSVVHTPSALSGQVLQQNQLTVPKTLTLTMSSGLVGQAGTALIAVGGIDDQWRITADPLNANLPRPADVVENMPWWLARLPNSRWISPAPGKYNGKLLVSHSFTYATSFNLAGCFSAAQLRMQLRGDDIIRRVVLNGVTIFNDPDPNATASATKPGSFQGPPLSIVHSANFQPVNQLEIVVADVKSLLTGLNVAATVTCSANLAVQ